MLGNALAVAIFVVALGILIVFGIKYCIDTRREVKFFRKSLGVTFLRKGSPLPPKASEIGSKHPAGDTSAFSPTQEVMPFIDESEELPSFPETRKNRTQNTGENIGNKKTAQVPFSPESRFSFQPVARAGLR